MCNNSECCDGSVVNQFWDGGRWYWTDTQLGYLGGWDWDPADILGIYQGQSGLWTLVLGFWQSFQMSLYAGITFCLTRTALTDKHSCASSSAKQTRACPSFWGKDHEDIQKFFTPWSTNFNAFPDLVFIFLDATNRPFVYTITVSNCSDTHSLFNLFNTSSLFGRRHFHFHSIIWPFISMYIIHSIKN